MNEPDGSGGPKYPLSDATICDMERRFSFRLRWPSWKRRECLAHGDEPERCAGHAIREVE